jgi:hypothetical protein
MNRRTFLRSTALAGTVTVAGCAGDDGGTGTTSPEGTATETLADSEVVELSGPPCEAIDGTTFKSVEKHDAGPGETTRAHWRVSFENGGYEYSHSDVVESGSYSCTVEDGTTTLEGSPGGSDRTYSGTYDPESDVLEWEEIRYRPVETA